MLRTLLAHPLTRGADLSNPRSVFLCRRIIEEKPLLRRIYEEWYAALTEAVPGGGGPVLEVGSGAGFLHEFMPELITSDIFPGPGVRLALDGQRLPFTEAALRGVVMTDVLHHLPHPRSFLAEAARCVRPGGVLAMIEPWVSGWSRLVYRHLQHEPFQPATLDWEFPLSGPQAGANIALPWLIFARDRQRFEREFPEWRIQTIRPMMPFRYLICGGMARRSLLPGFAFELVQRLEKKLEPRMQHWAMFAQIVLVRNFITDKDLATDKPPHRVGRATPARV